MQKLFSPLLNRLYLRRFLIFVLVIFSSCLGVYTYTRVIGSSSQVQAATSSNLNFQGRIYNSNGSVVPDGLYNLEFRIYDGGTQGGPAGVGQANAGTQLWTESYFDSNGVSPGNDNRVRVVNGYFSVNLGSQTAFPGTINWSEELWMTMNVGGSAQTATPTYDGEMLAPGNARTKLTGVPYAFQAGSAMSLIERQASLTGDLSWATLTQSRNILLPDADGTVLLDSTGFANGGNNFASGTATLGTNNTNDLIFETDNLEAMRIDQSGDVGIGTNADAVEKLEVNGGIKIGNTTNTNAGTIRWNGTDFEGYDGTSWKSLTLSGTLSVIPTANKSKTVTEIQNNVLNPTATLQPDDQLFFAVGANETWHYRFHLQITGNTAPDVKFSVTAPAGATCINSVSEAENALAVGNLGCGVSSGSVPMSTATDVFEIAGTIVNGATAGNVTLNWAQNTANAANTSVLAGSFLTATRVAGAGQTLQAFVQSGNAFGSTATIGTTDNQGLSFITNNVEAMSISSAGAAQFVNSVTVGNALTVTAGGADITGGIDNNNGGITNIGAISGLTTLSLSGAITGATATDTINGLVINAGSLSGITGFTQNAGNFSFNNNGGTFAVDSSGIDISAVGAVSNIASLTGSGALTVASGGAGALTFDSASNVLGIASSDTSLQRVAAGAFSFNLSDGANTTLNITNSGAGLAGLSVEGSLSAANAKFNVNTDGDITGAATVLNGTSTSNGVGANSTSLILVNAANFDIGNYVQVNSANCGGAGVNPCYAKITNKVVNTLTISPALSWANGSTVNEYHIPEIGGVNTSQPLSGRYGRGYFISGIATGNGTTFFGEDGITSSAASFDFLSGSATTLNIGGGSSTVNLGGTVNITGSITGDGAGLTNISASSISSGTIADSQLSSNVGLLNFSSNYTALQTFSAGLVVGNSASTTSGAIRWNGSDLEAYNGSGWVSLTRQGTVTSVTAGTGLSGGAISGIGTIDLANTTVAVGSYGSATGVATFTVNAQGQLTAAGTTAIQTATSGQNGLLTAADWSTFNAKENVLTFTGNGLFSRTGNTVTGLSCGTTGFAATWNGSAFACQGTTNSVNGLTGALTINTGTTGTDFNIAPSGTTITLNLPNAGTAARGLVTNAAQTIGGLKTFNDGISVTSCAAGTNVFCQDGNSLGADARVGTNDAFRLIMETSGNIRMVIDAAGNVGINTGAGTINSGLVVNTSLATAVVTLTATSALNATQQAIYVNAANTTQTLPNATTVSGRLYTIKNAAAGSNTTIASSGGTINGAATHILSNANDSVIVQSDGTNWQIVSGSSSLPQILVESRRTTAFALGAVAALPYNTATINVGTAYNTTTGVFTAPAAGVYEVTATAVVSMTPTGAGDFYLEIYNNTGVASIVQVWDGDSNDTGGAAYRTSSIGSRKITMTAGQQISIRIASNSGGAKSIFTTSATGTSLQIVRVR